MAKITLKIPGSGSFSGPNIKQEPSTAGSPPPFASLPPRLLSPAAAASVPGTPATEGRPKIKIRTSLPATPVDGIPPHLGAAMAPPPLPTLQINQTKVVKTKAGRIHKPTAKKRANGEMDGDSTDDELLSHQASAKGEPKPKKIKLLQTPITPGAPKTPALKVVNTGAHRQGRLPHRPDGDGYDSEAEDRELDPVIEEQFILRMMPGEHCDYLRRCIEDRRVGLPKSQGGADVAMRWVDGEMRRCMVTVQGTNYAGVLVDLPTITEGMKTWDKKSFVKSADICQMLLVFAKVADEHEARTVPLPKAVEHGYRWPHGLTPPMHDCIHRRFRKRLSKLEIQNKEAEVERLLRADKEALSTRFEFVDERQQNGDEQVWSDDEEVEEEEDGEADAEGEQEEDYFGDADITQHVEGDEAEMDVDDIEAMFEDDEAGPEEPGATPAIGDAATPMTTNGATPAAPPEAEDEGDSEEESEDGEGEEYGYMEEGEEEEDGEHDQKASVRNEIASLEKQKAGYQEQLRQSTSVIMRKRLEQNIRNTDAEIQLKKRSIGEVEDED
jgi:transcription initiation factor TFIID subunit 7